MEIVVMRWNDQQSQPMSWSSTVWRTTRSVLGFFTVAAGGYWLLRTGGDWWSSTKRWDTEEPRVLTLTDVSTESPFNISAFNLTEKLSNGLEFLSEDSGAVDMDESEPEEKSDERVLDTRQIKAGRRRLLQTVTVENPIPNQWANINQG